MTILDCIALVVAILWAILVIVAAFFPTAGSTNALAVVSGVMMAVISLLFTASGGRNGRHKK